VRSSPIGVRLAALFLLVAALIPAGCGGGSDSPNVSIDQPTDGATVQSPVAVALSAEGLEVGAHLHLLVDLPCDEPGSTEPAGEQRLRLGVGVEEAELRCPRASTRSAPRWRTPVTSRASRLRMSRSRSAGGAAASGGTTREEEAAGKRPGRDRSPATSRRGPTARPGRTTAGSASSSTRRSAVDGEGSTTSSEYTCTFPEGSTTIPATVLPYGIMGTKVPEAFELVFSDGVTMRLDISGTTATGTQDNSAGGGYTSVTTVELTCGAGC
jgi:hypothetical protein